MFRLFLIKIPVQTFSQALKLDLTAGSAGASRQGMNTRMHIEGIISEELGIDAKSTLALSIIDKCSGEMDLKIKSVFLRYGTKTVRKAAGEILLGKKNGRRKNKTDSIGSRKDQIGNPAGAALAGC